MSKVLLLGADGYLGWPLAMHLTLEGHDVLAVDNYFKRKLASEVGAMSLIPIPEMERRVRTFWLEVAGKKDLSSLARPRVGTLRFEERDVTVRSDLEALMAWAPDHIVHFAEQPSGPYSMMGREQASATLRNNLMGTFNLAWAVMDLRPEAHIIKVGTMGEYGTPGVPIPEGWMSLLDENGAEACRRLFPREAGSWYHQLKILETDMLHFYCRMKGLRVTDLMQGPVYGMETTGTGLAPDLRTSFHYDDVFGTVLNRFVTQAAVGHPLTIYGLGGQRRGYLNIRDTMQCVQLALENPAGEGELKVFNQFTQIFSVRDLAAAVQDAAVEAGLPRPELEHLPNPRKEQEDHSYEAEFEGFPDLGFTPTLLTTEVIGDMLEEVRCWSGNVHWSTIRPRVSWDHGWVKGASR